MQRSLRKAMTKEAVAHRKRALEEQRAVETGAATKIQAIIRGKAARNHVVAKRNPHAKREKQRRAAAAKDHHKHEPKAVIAQSWTKEENTAAISIQAVHRGKRTRVQQEEKQVVTCSASRGAFGRQQSSTRVSEANRHVGDASFEPLYACTPHVLLDHVHANQGGVAFSANGRQLAVCGGRVISLVDIKTAAVTHQETKSARVRCIALSADGMFLLEGGFGHCVTLQNVCEGARVYSYPLVNRGEEERSVKSLALSEDASFLAIGCEQGSIGVVEVWDARHDKRVLQRKQSKVVWAVALTRDGVILAAAGYSGELVLYNVQTLATLARVNFASGKASPSLGFIWSLDFSKDGRTLAVACWDNHAYIYRLEDETIENAHAKSTKDLLNVEKLKRADELTVHPAGWEPPKQVVRGSRMPAWSSTIGTTKSVSSAKAAFMRRHRSVSVQGLQVWNLLSSPPLFSLLLMLSLFGSRRG